MLQLAKTSGMAGAIDAGTSHDQTTAENTSRSKVDSP